MSIFMHFKISNFLSEAFIGGAKSLFIYILLYYITIINSFFIVVMFSVRFKFDLFVYFFNYFSTLPNLC